MAFIKQSGILSWGRSNIENTPDVVGVYTLRRGTTIESIVYIGMTSKLKERLTEHINLNDIPDVNYFDWYQTKNESEAEIIEKDWINKYMPIYNKKI